MSSPAAAAAPLAADAEGAEAARAAKKQQKKEKKKAAKEAAATGDAVTPVAVDAEQAGHEAAQLRLLALLQSRVGVAPSVDPSTLDRKARNKLEKALRMQLGLPKTGPVEEQLAQATTEDAAKTKSPQPATAAPSPSSDASSKSQRSSDRNGGRPPPRDSRLDQLPIELHIPQELLLAHPVANARRVEKENKLFAESRDAPDYVEQVAKVRAEFLASLPTAQGAGSVSGADGMASTVASGWDAHTKLVAEFVDEEPSTAAAAAAVAGSGAVAKVESGADESAASDEPAKKKSKKDRSASAAAPTTAPAAPAPLPLLHESYHPRFVSSFSWLPETSLRKKDLSLLDSASVLAYTASRMVRPGAPYPYARPALPMIFHPNTRGFEVDKPGIVALLMAARAAGVTFEEGSSAPQGAADSAMGTDASEKQEKKEKKKKRKHGKDDPADGSSSPVAASIPPSLPAPPRVRFASYRNNFRKFFSRRDFWRVDIQKVGRTIFLRRYLNYNYVNPFDVGHLFEQACKETNVVQGASQEAGGRAHGRKADSTTHPYRAIVEAELREFDLLTSIEIDLYQKHNQGSSGGASTPVVPAAVAPSDSLDTHSLPSSVSLPPNPLSSFLELKTVKKFRWDKTKKADVWIQTYLGGVPRTIVGYKQDGVRGGGGGGHGGRGAAGRDPPVSITEIVEAPTDELIDSRTKESLMERFYAVLRFLATHVQEGKVYKLEHRKRDAQPATPGAAGPARSHMFGWGIFLEEIEGGMHTQPVLVDGMLAAIDQWTREVAPQTEGAVTPAAGGVAGAVAAPTAPAAEEQEPAKKEKKKSKSKAKKSSKKNEDEGADVDMEDASNDKKKKKKSSKADKKADAPAATVASDSDDE